jgi:hypothetical protein
LDVIRTSSQGKIKASWIDPRNGQRRPAGRFADCGTKSFTTPKGWEDALLVLEL